LEEGTHDWAINSETTKKTGNRTDEIFFMLMNF